MGGEAAAGATAASADTEVRRGRERGGRVRHGIDISSCEPLTFELESSCLSPPAYERRSSLNARYDALDSFTGACVAGEHARRRAETEEIALATTKVDLAVDEAHPPAMSRSSSFTWQYDALEAGVAFARVAEAGCGLSPCSSPCPSPCNHSTGRFDAPGAGAAADAAASVGAHKEACDGFASKFAVDCMSPPPPAAPCGVTSAPRSLDVDAAERVGASVTAEVSGPPQKSAAWLSRVRDALGFGSCAICGLGGTTEGASSSGDRGGSKRPELATVADAAPGGEMHSWVSHWTA